MTTVEQETLPVTQADREAAAALCCSVTMLNNQVIASMIREGRADYNQFVQAFARHRADHEPRAVEVGLREALEALRGRTWFIIGVNDPAIVKADEALATLSPDPTSLEGGEGIESARRFLDRHTLGFVLANDERQEIARIMSAYTARPSTQPQADAGSADHSSTREG